jgi:hypothetical protein
MKVGLKCCCNYLSLLKMLLYIYLDKSKENWCEGKVTCWIWWFLEPKINNVNTFTAKHLKAHCN